MHSMSNRCEITAIPNVPDYALGEKLGAGSFGTVYKARLISSIQPRPSSAAYSRPSSARPSSALPAFFAIKCINRKALTKTAQDLLINEIALLKQIKHDHIVEMFDFKWDENYIYIVMEYCAGGDLSMFIRSRQQLTEIRARPFVQQIAKVLKFLYEKGISHMDLKPENILLMSVERPILKVADFGVAQHIGEQGSRSVRGTLMYMAPEILSSEPYDNRVDLWSIGVILYECLFGRPPFVFKSMDHLIYIIKSDIPIEIPYDAQISPECHDLLEKLLQRDPNKRISFADFFRHPFICSDVTPQIAHADNILQQAVNYEQIGDLKKALDLRVQVLDEYLTIIKIDEDADRRRMLRMKVQQGVAVAEGLKKRIKEMNMNSGSTTTLTNSPSSSPTVAQNEEFGLTEDKELFEAYQHCLNGNQLMNAFVFAKACEEYETGIGVMLRIARSETDPTKVKILRDVISHYLTKAETCKQRNETQRLDLAIEKIKQDAESDATIVNEPTNEEKKSKSAAQSTCRLQ